MGAWGHKVLDNDMAMDAMDEISDIVKNNIDALPFYTDLLILSRFESLQLLGIVILAICKVEPDEELYGTNYNHIKTWKTIHMRRRAGSPLLLSGGRNARFSDALPF